MLHKYLSYTFLFGTLRACAIISTAEYCRTHQKLLVTDNVGKCLMNGAVTPTLWPLFLYTDIRKLEVYLRKKNPDEYNADFFLFFE